MKTVLVAMSPEALDDRLRKGLDRWDEIWDGVLHMAPAPQVGHQRLLSGLIEFLAPQLRTSGRGELLPEISVFGSTSNFRIPDLTFVSAARSSLLHEDGVRAGGPDAVLEVRSPGDETYDKFPFFAALGTREFLVIDRDSKQPELFRLEGSQYVAVQPDHDGWLLSATMQVRFRLEPASSPQLAVEDVLDPAARTII